MPVSDGASRGLSLKGNLLAWFLLFGVFFLFVFTRLAWEDASLSAALWGDALPNVSQATTAFWHFRDGKGLWALLETDIYDTNLRAPLLYVTAAIHIAYSGVSHHTIVTHQVGTLILSALFLFLVLQRITGVAALGVLGALFFLASTDTIAMAHTFFLETPGAAAVSLSLLGFTGLVEGRRWGMATLGLGLALGLLSRQQLAFLLVLPVLIYAVPDLFRLIRRHPLKAALYLLGLPVFGMLLAIVIGRGTVLYSPLHFFLGAAILVALSVRPPLQMGVKMLRARGFSLALSGAAMMGLIWYISRISGVMKHYQGSSTGSHLRLSQAWSLIRFEYIILWMRTLGPILFILMIIGIVWAIVRWKKSHPTVHLALLALLTANLTYPIYFHARYVYPLLPFCLVLALHFWPKTRRLYVMAIPLVLLSFVNLGGWMLPIEIPSFPNSFLWSEQTNWHEKLNVDELWDARLEGAPLYGRVLSTVAPYSPAFSAASFVDVVEAACPDGEVCQLYYHMPPRSFDHDIINLDLEHMEYETDWVRGSQKVSVRKAAWPIVTFVLHRNNEDLTRWMASNHFVDWEVVEVIPQFGNMKGLLLRGLNAESDHIDIPIGYSWEDGW